jgi:Uma2 family endonuclease
MSMQTNTVLEILDVLEHNDALRRRLLDLLQTSRQRPTMTYEEFLEWIDEDTLAEWVDGEVIMTSPASFRHQAIVQFLVAVLGTFVQERRLGVVCSAPFQMKLEQSGREPDLLFITNEHRNRLKANYLDGPADLVVEVVSPESTTRDRGDKFFEYEQAGIPEYWLIDPTRQSAEFYRLDERGRYQTVQSGETGVFHSEVIQDFWLQLEWLWQPPTVLQALQELKVI